MSLKRTYATQEEIPESEREFYTQSGDVFVLDVEGGLKAEQDVTRLSGALEKERLAHKETKKRIQAFGDLTPEKLIELNDQVEDLRAQVEAGGKVDEKALEPLIARRLTTQLRPVERERDTLKTEVEKLREENGTLKGSDKRRRLADALSTATTGEKGVKLRAPSVLEDAKLRAERIFDENEDGVFTTKDGVTVADWFLDLQRGGTVPHWFPENQGAGAANGGDRKAAGANPLKAKKPNMTEWAKLCRSNPALAQRYAQEAGRADLLPANLRPKSAAA